ncbi:hypothetical protein ACN28G_09005 [Micromonospora sp. WMMA1923]|uniref:hypothetical protein n=1 Tax=Micromonospora sp. WMMA1923 TaxID=3404125 RepID=UPI003B959623
MSIRPAGNAISDSRRALPDGEQSALIRSMADCRPTLSSTASSARTPNSLANRAGVTVQAPPARSPSEGSSWPPR